MHAVFKKLSLAILLPLGGIMAALGAAEIGVRLLLPAPQIVTVKENTEYLTQAAQEQAQPLEATYEDGSIYTFENPFYLRTPTGLRMRRNGTVTIENEGVCRCRSQIKTNALGYRGPEIGPKDPKKKRVLFLGDSITLAHYVPEERSWVRQVETLSQKMKQPLETINSAVAAIGLADELAILQETGLSTEPEMVVLGVYLNDVQGSPAIYIKQLPPWLSWSWLAQHVVKRFDVLNARFGESNLSNVDYNMMVGWAKETLKVRPTPVDKPQTPEEELNQKIQTFFGDWGSAFSAGVWEHLRPMFYEIKRLSEVHGFKFVIVMHPVADQVYYDELFDFPQRKMREIADEMGVPMLDLLPLLHQVRKERNPQIFYDWCHHTPEGNDLVAGWVVDFLEQQW